MPSPTLVAALASILALGSGCGHAATPATTARAPASSAAPAAATDASAPSAAEGTHAPDAQLTDSSGAKVALAELLHQHAQTVVVFYRGFW
jgi:hypothetical protein